MTKFLLTVVLCLAAMGLAAGQNVKGYYLAKTEADGTIYHTLPSALFENKESGEMIFDITYKTNSTKQAVINFTYEMGTVTPIDSVCFISGPTRMSGTVEKLYIAPEKKTWKHRYTFSTDVKALYVFFDTAAVPSVKLYSQGKAYVYGVKSSAWKKYAPVGYKIFEMIRLDESR